MGSIGRGSALTIAGQAINKMMSCDMNSTNNLADDTTNDSNGYIENAYADQQISLDVTCKYDETGSAGIDKVLDEFFDRTSSTYVFTPVAAGLTYSFSGRVSSLNISSSTGETVEISFTIESTGAITFSG